MLNFDLKIKEAFALIEAEELCEHNLATVIISEEFKRRTAQLLKRYDHFWYHWFNTTAKRVAIILLMVFTITFGTTMSVEALREPFLQFIAETFERYTNISFLPNNTTSSESAPLTPIDPNYLPEGYRLIVEEIDLFSNKKTYSNGQHSIYYTQRIKDGSQLHLDSEDALSEKIQINETELLLITEEDRVQLFFTDKNHFFLIAGTIDKQELIQMAQSILEKN